MNKLSNLLIISNAIFALSACGGGDPVYTKQTAGGPDILVTDKYKGNWKFFQCSNWPGQPQLVDWLGPTTFQEQTYSSVNNTANSITFVRTIKTYSPSDTNCAGEVLMTQTFTPQTFNFGGATVYDGQNADLVITSNGEQMSTLVSGSVTMTNGFSARAFTINGLFMNTGYFEQNMFTTVPFNSTAPYISSSMDGTKRYMRATETKMYLYNEIGFSTPGTIPLPQILTKF